MRAITALMRRIVKMGSITALMKRVLMVMITRFHLISHQIRVFIFYIDYSLKK